MNKNKENSLYGIKSFFKYITTVVSWTIFVLLFALGILLLYYYISVRLYSTKGENYEPAFSIYTVASGSMEPTISYLDVIVNLKTKSIDDVNINDVVTFISTWDVNYGMTMTHRVVGKQLTDDGKTCLITKGDWNTQEDQTCVTEENLIGVVKVVVPQLGKIQMFLSSTLGWLLIIIIPALYIIVKDIIKICNLKIINKNKNTKDYEETIRAFHDDGKYNYDNNMLDDNINNDKDNDYFKNDKLDNFKEKNKDDRYYDDYNFKDNANNNNRLDDIEKTKENIFKENKDNSYYDDYNFKDNANNNNRLDDIEKTKENIFKENKDNSYYDDYFKNNKTEDKLDNFNKIKEDTFKEENKDNDNLDELQKRLQKAYEDLEKVRIK